MTRSLFQVELSWSQDVPDPNIAEWVVYRSTERLLKGKPVAVVPKNQTRAVFEAPEGSAYYRVIPRGADGTEGTWEDVEPELLRVSAAKLPDQDLPVNLGAGPAEPFGGNVRLDPASIGNRKAEAVEVIRGPDQYCGHLVHAQPLYDEAMDGDDFSLGDYAQAPIPLIGQGQPSQKFWVVTRGADGDMTKGCFEDQFIPPRHNCEVDPIASWSGASQNGFPALPTITPWEADATDGYRFKLIPDCTTVDTSFTDKSGPMCDTPRMARYLTKGKLESNEIDMGTIMYGLLDIHHEFQRKSADAAGIKSRYLCVPSQPHMQPEIEGTKESADWLAKLLRTDCKPTRPLRNIQWFVRWDDTSPISNPYVVYRPGMWIKARYVRVKVAVEDPTGLWQVICPAASINLLVPRTVQMGEATSSSGGTTTVNLVNDPILAASPFQNTMNVQLTVRKSGNTQNLSPVVVTIAPTGSPPSFTFEVRDNADNRVAETVMWRVEGY